MKLRIAYYLLILLFTITCKKNDNAPCEITRKDFYIPDTLFTWYSKVMDKNLTTKNFSCKSSTGLSETMVVSKFYQDQSFEECYEFTYHQNAFYYTSLTYDNNFEVGIEFENNMSYPNGWGERDFKVHTDKVYLYINYSIKTGSKYSGQYLDLRQPLAPVYKNNMSVVYYREDIPVSNANYIQCDTCVQYIGSVLQNGKSFNDVFRYISPINYGLPETCSEFLIDKDYGLIQFKKRDGTIWTLDNF